MMRAKSPSAFVVLGPNAFEYQTGKKPGLNRRAINESAKPYRSSGTPAGPEKILHQAWRNASLERASVSGRDGHTYSIVYGGKPGGSLGPDFTDAVIERDDGVTFRGDIEIHVRESDWRAHGHQVDPRYNGVVLHVVGAVSPGSEVLRATGTSIPLLTLNWKKHREPERQRTKPPTVHIDRPAKPSLPLAQAGLERFHAQAAGIALDIKNHGKNQALWLGVMGALGYPRNKRAFRELATAVPWSTIENSTSAIEIAEILVAASGLDHDHRPSDRARQLARLASRPNWIKPWGRPANSPKARINSIAQIAAVWKSNSDIASFAIDSVDRAQKPGDLVAMFRPPELLKAKPANLLGRGRASEIVINVLLPGVFALATREIRSTRSSTILKDRCVGLFSSHPKLPANSVTKEAEIALGIDHELPPISTARDQQGLIVLYREMFRHGTRSRQPRLPGV